MVFFMFKITSQIITIFFFNEFKYIFKLLNELSEMYMEYFFPYTYLKLITSRLLIESSKAVL